MSNLVFLFPGQGSQFIGMGKALLESFTEAKEVFQEVDHSLNRGLSKIIFEGDPEDLTKTENAQPAIMATSMAVAKVLEKQSGKKLNQFAIAMAGHSLGEYSALCASRAFSLNDASKLLHIRGTSMQAAVPLGKGSMAALIGATIETTEKLLKEASNFGLCQIANDNGAGQIVISGAVEAIEKAIELAPSVGIRKAIKLPVSAPFHSEMMKPAAIAMERALSETEISLPNCNTISNVNVAAYKSVNEIKDALVSQVTSRVRWRETMEYFIDSGITEYVELGPNKVLSSLAKRMHGDANVSNILEPQDIENFLNNYN